MQPAGRRYRRGHDAPARPSRRAACTPLPEVAAALFAPTLVLIGAWLLGGAMQALGTADVIARLLGGDLPVWLFPGAVFLAGAAISFSTGTSWGTMGILMPLSIPVAFKLTGGTPGELMPAVVGAVFSGAVFGDHCLPHQRHHAGQLNLRWRPARGPCAHANALRAHLRRSGTRARLLSRWASDCPAGPGSDSAQVALCLLAWLLRRRQKD